MKGKANRKRKVLVVNLLNWDVEIFPMVLNAARFIKTNPTHLVHVLKKERSIVKNHFVSYLCSVETNSDECNCVGSETRTDSKCAASYKEEEIVHAVRMENLQTQRDRGYIQLAMRSGQFRTINVRDVRDGEIVDEDFVSGELKFKKLPDAERANAPVIGFVAYFELMNGFRKMSYWTVAELKAHGMRYSQTYSSKNDYVRKNSKWETDFEAMASKTVLKLLLAKYAPLSVEMQDAVVSDQAVFRKSDSDVNYVDNEQEVATKIEAAEEMKALDLSNTSNWTADDFDNAVLKGLMSKEEAQALKQLHSEQ